MQRTRVFKKNVISEAFYEFDAEWGCHHCTRMLEYLLNVVVFIRDGNPNPTKFLDPERIRIRNLNFGFVDFKTFVAFRNRRKANVQIFF